MKQIFIIFLLLLALCSCADASIADSGITLSEVQTLNLSNGGCVSEAPDGTVYYTANQEGMWGIHAIATSGDETCILSDSVSFVYATERALYYKLISDDSLYALDFETNETAQIHDRGASSIASVSNGIYFLSRRSLESPFELYFCADRATSEPCEIVGIPVDDRLRFVYAVDDNLYVVAGNDVYYIDEDYKAKKVFETPEPLHKIFKVNKNFYAVGNHEIFKLDAEGTYTSIAPQYKDAGKATSVVVLNDSIIYSAFGTYEFNTRTEKTDMISNAMYQNIYVVNGEAIGIANRGSKRVYEKVR